MEDDLRLEEAEHCRSSSTSELGRAGIIDLLILLVWVDHLPCYQLQGEETVSFA